MRSGRISIFLFIFLVIIYALIFPSFEKARKNVTVGEVKGLNLPPFVIKLMAFEFKSVAADLYFVRASQFYGGRVDRLDKVTRDDWEWFYTNLWIATELDPYFEDPYSLGNAFLTWDAGLYVQANDLLQKGMDARTWDWILPFYIGFNHFYFLQESDRASEYLMEASKRPDASPMLASLATRLAHKGKRTENAITFLKKILQDTTDERLKKEYETRLAAFEKILFLEKAVTVYNERFEKAPFSLNALITAGIIARLPEDPYGGEFYIDTEGSIKTTSDLRPMK